jgi:hypothetical protein
MGTAPKLAQVQGKNERKRPVTEMRDRVVVPILVRDYLSGIAQEKQIAHAREGVALCESMVTPNAESAR